jgi:ribosomal protein S18 acetylase RimI-like enzyme
MSRHSSKMAYSISQLKTQDYASVKDIFRETFLQEGVPIDTLGYRWRNRSLSNSFGVYTYAGDLIGFAIVSDGSHFQEQKQKKTTTKPDKSVPSRYLSLLALHPSFRGTNIGSQLLILLLQKTIRDGKSLCLYPLDNERLKEWYKRYGFYESVKEYYNFHFHYTRKQAKYLDKIQTNGRHCLIK